MFGQPCHNLATVSKYKVVKKHCGNLVPRLCQPCHFCMGRELFLVEIILDLCFFLFVFLSFSCSFLLVSFPDPAFKLDKGLAHFA